MRKPITTNEQYRNIVYLLRTYRWLYETTYSSVYQAAYNELIALLYDARERGLFLVTSLSFPSVISIRAVENTGTICLTKTEIYKMVS